MSPSSDQSRFRVEQDSMGEVRVPAQVHYGSQTQRAADNFFTSGLKPPIALIHALAMIKLYAARTNTALGLLDEKLSRAVAAAAREVMSAS